MSDLASVKVGDKVLYSGGFSCEQHIETVSRVTATQIICGNMRFRKSDGFAVGSDSYSRSMIRLGTAEKFAEVRHRNAADRISQTDRAAWRKLTLEQLTTISKWLEEAKAS